ncbi:QsdR family transcriptional regulator [Marinobacter sp.]|uniref:QsdR family transcriptional regulator n=1 Tax=Marinobacter sp. TaxID=50741 RepID=UPI0035665E37
MTRQQNTPLSQFVERPSQRATPLDVLKEARRRWLRGERISLNDLAESVGIGRTTLFRWVGTKELLMAEIMWSVYEPTLQEAREKAKGTGADYIANICRFTMTAVINSQPLRQFISDDPQFALQVLTSTRFLQERRLNAMKQLLTEEIDKGTIRPELETDSLALVIIRLTETFTYSDLIVGRPIAINEACKAIRTLCGSHPCPPP